MTTSRSRLDTLAELMRSRLSTPLAQSAEYGAQMGTLADGLRDDRDDAAGRAAAYGLSPGAAMAAGAGARSRALAAGTRSAVASAEASRERDRSALLQLTQQQVQLDEAERARREERRRQLLATLVQLGGTAAGFALAGPIGAAAGGGGMKSTLT